MRNGAANGCVGVVTGASGAAASSSSGGGGGGSVSMPIPSRMARFEHTCPGIHLLAWMDTQSAGSRKRKRRLVELRGKHFTMREDEDVTLNDGCVTRSDTELELKVVVKTKHVYLFPKDREELLTWHVGLTYAFAKVEDFYDIGEELGRGAFSKVFSCVHREKQHLCAIKVVSRIAAEDIQLTARETSILASCVHENIIRTFDIFESRKKVCFVMEYLPGGELYDIIADSDFVSEENARDVIRDVLRGVSYLHSCSIAHRDLKPENLLCTDKQFPLSVKVTDFGLSNYLDSRKKDRMLRTVCGSPNYIAPEMLRADGYGPEVDLWACGVILYVMLSGTLPFSFKGDTYQFMKTLMCGVRFDEKVWASKSREGRDLVQGLLEVDPQRRLTAAEALNHPWFLPTTRMSSQALTGLSSIRLLKSYRGPYTNTEHNNPRVRLPKKGTII